MQDSEDKRDDRAQKDGAPPAPADKPPVDEWQHAENQHEETEREVDDELARLSRKPS